MPNEYDPSNEILTLSECPKPMLAAIQQLATDSARPIESLVGWSFAEIAELAFETYDELPDFWRTWKEWHSPQPDPDFGDL